MVSRRTLKPENPEKRETALLTQGYREYLTGNKEKMEDPHENQLRLRIRKRIQNGIQDFRQIRRLSDKDKELIFSNATTDSSLTEGILHLVVFIYEGIVEYTNLNFETILEAAIMTAELRRSQDRDYNISEVEVSIDKSYRRLDSVNELRERLDQGDELTNSEIGRLVRQGRLTSEDLPRLDISDYDPESTLSEGFFETDWLHLVEYPDAERE